MYTLNSQQRSLLDHYADRARKERDELIGRIQKAAAEEPGRLADRLSWIAEGTMYADLLVMFFAHIVDALDGAGNAATLQSVTEYFQRDLRGWSPGRSSSASDNLAKNARYDALKAVTEHLETMLGMEGPE